MIVLDASVVIAYLDGADANHRAAVELLIREIDDDFAMSVIALAEVLVAPVQQDRADVVLEVLRELEVTATPMSADAAVSLAQLRATTGLKMPDCCVLLAAEDQGARLATFDERLGRASVRRGVTTVAV